MTDIDVKAKIDRLAEIKRESEQLKAEKDTIEAELLKNAESDLANTKYKSVSYAGTNSSVTATVADSVKITYASFLPVIFGKAYSDLTKTTTKVELTDPAKRLIAGIWTGNYDNHSTVDEVIKAMALDEKTEKLIRKKCKGINYSKDVANLKAIVGYNDTQAQEYAYMLMEAAVWQQFKALLEVNGVTSDEEISDILDKIQAAFVVEQTPKISLTEV